MSSMSNPPAGDDPDWVAPVVQYDSPAKRQETTAWVGMVIFLASWGMMFGALFFMYGGIRARATEWPPQGLPSIPLFWPTINTIVIALSSVTLQWALISIRKGDKKKLTVGLVSTFLLGLAFVALQWKVWVDLNEIGLMHTSGFYGSVFYGMTWIHAAHVAVGIIALGWLCIQALRLFYSAPRHLSIRLWTMYWHFVGIVWGIMFLTVYIL